MGARARRRAQCPPGMFAQPLGLFALLAVPLVVGLHLYRRRFEPRLVSALFLWQSEEQVPLAGRKREPLRQSVSFWCEVLAATLLALCLAGPRGACVAARAEHLVIVLDASASMEATFDGQSTRARAVELVRERIDGLRRGSRVTLIQSGPRPSLLAGPAAFPAEAEAALEGYRPLAASHDLTPALALALQFSGDARVTLVTDHHEPERWPASVELVSLGQPLDNWAITHAARTRERAAGGGVEERVFVTLTSYARTPRTCLVRVLAGASELARREETLAARARTHFAFTLPEGAGPVEVRLEPDGLALDDAVLLAAPPRRTLALASELPAEELERLGLGADLARLEDLIEDALVVPSAAGAHLVLAREPAPAPQAWTLVLPTLGTERSDFVGPFLADRASELLDGLTLEGAVWSADPALLLPGTPLVSAGNLALLSEERRGARSDWHLALDPERSSLQRSPDWPILLVNLAERRRAALPGPVRTNLGVGERLVYRPGDELVGLARGERLEYELEGPLGSPRASKRVVPALEEVVVDGLDEPGLHRLSFRGRAVAEVAVHFADGAESDLSTALPGRREVERGSAALEAEFSPLELLGLLLVLGLLALDWWSLSRGAAAARVAA